MSTMYPSEREEFNWAMGDKNAEIATLRATVEQQAARITELQGWKDRTIATALEVGQQLGPEYDGMSYPEVLHTLQARITELEQQLQQPVRTGCDDCLDARRAADARITALEQALRFYANPFGPDFYSEMAFGEVARQALEGTR